MKKLFVFAASAMMVFASCTNNEVVYDNETPQEIGLFSVVNNMTRAAIDGTSFTHENMAVAAYLAKGSATAGNYFGKTLFEGSGENYTGGQYWPIQTTTLNFLAVAPEIEDQVVSAFDTTAPASKVEVEVTDNQIYQNDVMYAVAQGTRTVNAEVSSVGMVFKHALAWVNFAFKKGENTDDATITINSITLNGATYDGSLTVTLEDFNSVEAIDSDDASFEWDFADIEPVESITVPNSSTSSLTLGDTQFDTYGDGLLVAPTTTAASDFIINYTITANGNSHIYEYTYDAKVDGTPANATYTDAAKLIWTAGKKYTYNITMSFQEIQISPSVESWGTSVDTPVDIN